MSRRSEGQLFVGRLSKNTRTRDLEEIFETYGRMIRCEIKYGAEMAYAFVDYEDRRDAEDALKFENGREICGSCIIVEWAKGSPRRPLGSSQHYSDRGQISRNQQHGYDECYKCHRVGHWARDCPDDRYYGYRRPRRGSERDREREQRRRTRSRSKSREHRRRSRSRSRERHNSPSRSRSRSSSA